MNFSITASPGTVLCKELSLKDYKELLKASYGDDPDLSLFCRTLHDVYTNLLPQKFVEELTILDGLLVLIQIRIASLGDVASIALKNVDVATTIELNLNWLLEDLQEFESQWKDKLFEVRNNIHLAVGIPYFTKDLEQMESKGDDSTLFLKRLVEIAEDGTYLQTLKRKDLLKKVFDTMPVKTTAGIFKLINDCVAQASSINTLNRYNIDSEAKLSFIPHPTTLLWYTKILFNEQLETFYDNIFNLIHHSHFDGAFLDTCTPGEYKYFVNKQQLLSKEQETSSDNFVDESDMDQ